MAIDITDPQEAHMRAAFETWASDGGEYPRAIERGPQGYLLMHTAQMWRTWRAAWDAAKVAPGAITLTVRDNRHQ